MFRSLVQSVSRGLHTTATALQASAAPTTPAAAAGASAAVSGATQRAGSIAVKKGMTAIWDPWGVRVPVTLLQLDSVYVTQVKTPETDGYYGVQVGAGLAKPHRAGKSVVAHCTKAQAPPLKEFAEFKVTPDALLPAGHQLTAAHYQVGQFIDVRGVTVGKGFQGVMKRWGFKGQPATHGVSVTHRSLGSTGQCQDPGRVFKGKKMAGHMGAKYRTTLNLQIVKIDHDSNVLYVKGGVPGHDNAFITIRDAVKQYNKTSGPVPTADKAKTGAELLEKQGSDPYLRYESA
ncbi:54S ribosomal protein L3 [Allomyces javanicus]|nr:54S ribosomal protein L3 [Allomyces javanicus]